MKPTTLLVVEDNQINQKVLRIILDKMKLDYRIVGDGISAVKLFEMQNFSLVLMDCQLPEMDGLTATQKIRRIESELKRDKIPILAMTANAMEGDRLKCMQAGMDDFLAKPFKSQELVVLLRTWLKPKGEAHVDS